MTEREHLRNIRAAFEKAGHKFEIMADHGGRKLNSKPFDAILALKDRAGFCFIEAKIKNKPLTDEQFAFQADCRNRDIPCYVLRICTIENQHFYDVQYLLPGGLFSPVVSDQIEYYNLEEMIQAFETICKNNR